MHNSDVGAMQVGVKQMIVDASELLQLLGAGEGRRDLQTTHKQNNSISTHECMKQSLKTNKEREREREREEKEQVRTIPAAAGSLLDSRGGSQCRVLFSQSAKRKASVIVRTT